MVRLSLAAILGLSIGEPECHKREEAGRVPANPYEPVPFLCGEGHRR
jgi:hypothetical protein